MPRTDKLTMTGLLDKKYWSKRLVKQLLGEPDEIVLKPNGDPARKYYFTSRIAEAEASGPFLDVKNEADIKANKHQKRLADLREGMRYAIELDLKSITVPKAGALDSVLEYVNSQMTLYNKITDKTDEFLISEAIQVYDRSIRPIFQICEKIAVERPDLAFEAGKKYERSNFYG